MTRSNSELKTALIWTVASRLAYSVLGALAAPYLKLNSTLIHSNDLTDNLMPHEAGWPYRLLGVWERFDTLWYVEISRHGYARPDAVVFFPLYPLLIRLLSEAMSPLAAALVISTVAAFFAFWGFQKLLALDLPKETVKRALLFFALWPTAFILFAGYPESLLIALMIWAVWHARNGRWWLAGILGLMAGLTKAVGFCILVPLAVLAFKEWRWRTWPSFLPLLAAPLVTLAVWLSGQSLASDAYPKHWRTEIAFPLTTLWTSLREAFMTFDAVLLLNLLALAVVFIPTFLKRIRSEYLLFSLSALTMFLAKKTDPLLQSSSRYVLAVFPAFGSLAVLIKHPFLIALGLIVLCLLQVLLLWSFFEWALVV
ncbi:MAG: hypothetical protein JST85_14275 [Acidobacteria bacterium]|nr:hypothetical protein [Acidobacteriota bacterium]